MVEKFTERKLAPRPTTPEQRARIPLARRKELEAEAKALVDKELQKEAELAYLEEQKKLMRDMEDPNEERFSVRIELPDSAPYIMLDGRPDRTFYPYRNYSVNKRTYDTLQEIMWRSKKEDDIRKGENVNAYRRQLNEVRSGRNYT